MKRSASEGSPAQDFRDPPAISSRVHPALLKCPAMALSKSISLKDESLVALRHLSRASSRALSTCGAVAERSHSVPLCGIADLFLDPLPAGGCLNLTKRLRTTKARSQRISVEPFGECIEVQRHQLFGVDFVSPCPSGTLVEMRIDYSKPRRRRIIIKALVLRVKCVAKVSTSLGLSVVAERNCWHIGRQQLHR